MSTTTLTPVSEIVVGSKLLKERNLGGDDYIVEVTRLQTLHRLGQVRIWVKTVGGAARLSEWRFGTFQPTDTVPQVTP